MTQLSIELPDELRKKAEARAAERGHASLAKYVEALVAEDAECDFGAPPHLSIKSQEQLEALLREGSTDPATELDDAYWDQLRRRIQGSAQSKAG